MHVNRDGANPNGAEKELSNALFRVKKYRKTAEIWGFEC